VHAKAGRLLDGAPIGYFETRVQHKTGSYRWIGWTAAAFHAEKLVYIFGRDITEKKAAEAEIGELNRELTRRVQQLTETNKELEAFCYSISHDLRAPLRAMYGFSQALEDDYAKSLDATGRGYLQRIVESSRFMDSMLNDLLEYSRLTLSELPMSELDLREEVEVVLRSLDRNIAARNARVEVLMDAHRAWGHQLTFRQVILNLITNALKFVPPGRTPHVRITSRNSGNFSTISVEDNGVGIPEEHQHRIFGLFERLHRDPSYPGTGVGLAIVRRAVERMGGRVGIDSVVDEGSRFWVELPKVQS
jgi:signal transduction histidine kinase